MNCLYSKTTTEVNVYFNAKALKTPQKKGEKKKQPQNSFTLSMKMLTFILWLDVPLGHLYSLRMSAKRSMSITKPHTIKENKVFNKDEKFKTRK